MCLRVSSVMIAALALSPVCMADEKLTPPPPVMLAQDSSDRPVLIALQTPRGFIAPDDNVALLGAPLVRLRREARQTGFNLSLDLPGAGALEEAISFYDSAQWRPTVKGGAPALEWRVSFGAKQN